MLGKPKYHSQFYHLLLQALGEAHVSIREIDRITYARDANFQSTIQVRAKHFPYPPDLIAWPKGADEVAKVFKLARRYRVPVIPYGGGSGVCGGTVPTKGGLILDMKRNDVLLEVNKRENWACVESGIYGEQLERLLNRKGYTLGHFPSSIYCSTVGGWLATRSAGQFSSRYGKIEDMVIALEVVTPNGRTVITPYVKNRPDAMDWNQLFIGTEGTLGAITKAWLKIHSLPEKRFFRGIRFPKLEQGLDAMRTILQHGLAPSVLRLYDELDTMILLSDYRAEQSPAWLSRFKGLAMIPFNPVLKTVKEWGMRRGLQLPGLSNYLADFLQQDVLCILGCEGLEKTAEYELGQCIESCLEHDGEDLGTDVGDYWFAHRYDVSYKASPLFYQGHFLDTMEVATTWDRLEELYDTVKKAIAPHALVMAHLSHAYHDGCSIYFTFLASAATTAKSEALFETVWKVGLTACQSVGGVISHHHGIGRLKVDYMNREWNEGVELLRGFKKEWDPRYTMNPGKLIPYRD